MKKLIQFVDKMLDKFDDNFGWFFTNPNKLK